MKTSLGIFGIACCLLFAFAIILAEIMIRKLRKKRKTALEELGKSTEDEFVAGHWASISFSIFTIFAIIGWIIILVSS